MAELVVETEQQVVEQYFHLIRDLRAGKQAAIQALTDLWDADGTFEFAGAPPVTGIFKGKAAIHTLYKNRCNSSGMSLNLEAKGLHEEAALGTVDTTVHKTKVMDGKIVAGWTTIIGTRDGRGFEVAGSHTFTFKEGKISSLKVVVSPKHDSTPTLKSESLAVNDIGRLALAAWAVV